MASLVALLACGDDGASSSATEGSSSSGGAAPMMDESADGLPTACTPGQSRACYEGPFGTADIGICRSGQQICAADGSGWSECSGEVWPEPDEDCPTPQDEDCDGSTLCEPVIEWLRTIPGLVEHIDVEPDGGVVAAGFGYGAGFDPPLELFDTFVLELDADGEVRWDRSIVESDHQEIHDLEVDDQGRITVVGRYEGQPDFGGGPLPPAIGFDSFAVRYDTDGEPLWSHSLAPDGYYAVALDPEGTTYVAGGAINVVFEDEPVLGNFFVAAIDPGGELSWVTAGYGAFIQSEYWFSLALTGEQELVAMIVLAPTSEPELGGMPFELLGVEPVLLRLSTDGTPLGHSRLAEQPPFVTGRLHLHGRQSGVMSASSLVLPVDGGYGARVLLAGFDGQLAPVSESLIGKDVWLSSADPYALGGTVVAVEFTGQLQLGHLGVTAAAFPTGQAVTVVDDQGQANWVEVLHSDNYAELRTVASTPDGAVIVSGDVSGVATLGSRTVEGPFIAKLRP